MSFKYYVSVCTLKMGTLSFLNAMTILKPVGQFRLKLKTCFHFLNILSKKRLYHFTSYSMCSVTITYLLLTFDYRILESSRLGKSYKIIKSDCLPITNSSHLTMSLNTTSKCFLNTSCVGDSKAICCGIYIVDQ